MSGHIPEPWYVEAMLAGGLGVRSKGGYICTLVKPMRYDNQEARYKAEMEAYEAKAHLIAAAPETCDKIEAALKEWDIMPQERAFTVAEITDWLQRSMAPAMEDLRMIIAKAEGHLS